MVESGASTGKSSLPDLLHAGTSSWSSDDWKTAGFYPKEMKPGEYLSHYARTYNTVEVDSTFYRPPSAWLCKKWFKDTPDDFTFALKVPRAITHDKVLEGAGKEFESFLAALGELGPKLGFILFQFAYFNKKSVCPDLGSFLKRWEAFAPACPKGFRYVVEVRNPRWIGPELLDFLRERNFSLALADQQWMDRPTELWKRFGNQILTADTAYIRFLGERKRIEELTGSWDKLVIDRSKETAEWFPLLDAFLDQGVPIWVYFNNHYAGHAPASIELLRRLWENR